MRFLVDAQLPRRLATWFRSAGHDARHTLDLAQGNRTPDSVLVSIAQREDRIVVTKDDDFVQSHLLANQPEKLLLIATGNISNIALETLLATNMPAIERAFGDGCFVELGVDTLTVHR